MSAGGGLLSKPKPFGDSSYSVQLAVTIVSHF